MILKERKAEQNTLSGLATQQKKTTFRGIDSNFHSYITYAEGLH